MTTATAHARTLPTHWGGMLGAAAGPAFVVLVLAGNSLTETDAPEAGGTPARDALAGIAARVGNRTVEAGTVMELVGFVCLAVFAAYLHGLLRRRRAESAAGSLALIGAVLLLAVKLGSVASYLAALNHHESLTPTTALALVETNGAAFVVGWMPWGIFVAAAAVALHAAGLLGRVGAAAGVLIGTLGVVAMVLGSFDTGSANPLPFLAGLVWTLVVGMRLALAEARPVAIGGTTGATA
jgi:hypothetical protein